MAVKKSGKKAVKKPVKKTVKNVVKKSETIKVLEDAGLAEEISAQTDADIQEILTRILSEMKEPEEATNKSSQKTRKSRLSMSRPDFSRPRLVTSFPFKERSIPTISPIKITLPIVLVAVLVVSGFWGRQIVGVLGFPVNPAPFTAIYFDDPHIAGTGITNGSTLSFGMHNGYPKSKTIKWKVLIGESILKTGKVELEPFSSQNVKLRVTKGQPGDFLSISSDALKTPISAVISQ